MDEAKAEVGRNVTSRPQENPSNQKNNKQLARNCFGRTSSHDPKPETTAEFGTARSCSFFVFAMNEDEPPNKLSH